MGAIVRPAGLAVALGALAAPAAARADGAPAPDAYWENVYPISGEVPENTVFRLHARDFFALPDGAWTVTLKQADQVLPSTATLTRGPDTYLSVVVVPDAPLPVGDVAVHAHFSACYGSECTQPGDATLAVVTVVAGTDDEAPPAPTLGEPTLLHNLACPQEYLTAQVPLGSPEAGALLVIEDPVSGQTLLAGTVAPNSAMNLYAECSGADSGLEQQLVAIAYDVAGNASAEVTRTISVKCADVPLEVLEACDEGGCSVAPASRAASGRRNGEGTTLVLLAVGVLGGLGWTTWSRPRRRAPSRPNRRR